MVSVTFTTTAPSGSIQGVPSTLNTSLRSSVQWPACAQMARLSKIVIDLPAYVLRVFFAGSASFWSRKPLVLWVPSQNGLFFDPPHRQRENPTMALYFPPAGLWRVSTVTAVGSLMRR